MNITLFNGGRGASSIIKSLKNYNNINISSIVNAYDDGKSTGEIRSFFNMLGPSDLRKVQSIFLDSKNHLYNYNIDFFNYRLPKNITNSLAKDEIMKLFSNISNDKNIFGIDNFIFSKMKKFINIFLNKLNYLEFEKSRKFNFDDCSIMNCLYAGAYTYFNEDLIKTIEYFSYLFKIENKILPNSIENLKLIALRENGEIIFKEADIVSLRSNVKIYKIFLIKSTDEIDLNYLSKISFNEKLKYLDKLNFNVQISNSLIKIIKDSDIIIYSPGTQHSSLLPTYMTNSIGDLISNNKNCLKVFISNIGADYENPVYIASDYLYNSFKYLNSSSMKKNLLKDFFNFLLINEPLISNDANKVKFDNKIIETGIDYQRINLEDIKNHGHHDGNKVVELIFKKFNHLKKQN